MSKIDGVNSTQMDQMEQTDRTADEDDSGGGFGEMLGSVADKALGGVAAAAPVLPGGELIGMAANGLRGMSDQAPAGLDGAEGEQLDQMWDTHEDNQVFNMQYMQLQQQMQADNREFSTMSNLLKARHDTAKSAINNMRV